MLKCTISSAPGASTRLTSPASAGPTWCQARELLDEALDLSLAISIIRHVTLCLAAFAQLVFAEGDPERAALLAGAAEGVRRRDLARISACRHRPLSCPVVTYCDWLT